MPKRKITKQPGKLETALWIIGVYIILFAFNYFGSSSEVYLTNRIYVSTKEDIWLWTFIQVVTLAIILIAFIVTLKLCIKALKSPYRNYYFGTFLLLLGGGGLSAMLLTAPKDLLQKNIHVPIIGAVIAAFGILMLIKGKLK